MAISVGSRLSQDELTALLGEGGMGRVFEARDTRLGRTRGHGALLGKRESAGHPSQVVATIRSDQRSETERLSADNAGIESAGGSDQEREARTTAYREAV